MGRRRTPGLEWLDPEDRKQRQWALNYLWERDLLPDSKGPRRLLIGDEETQEIGDEMELNAEGRVVLKLMKEAWRQKRRRDTNSSVQTCTFTLKTTSKDNLKEIADGQNKSVTALLESLIDKAYKAQIARERKQTLRAPIPAELTSSISRPIDRPHETKRARSQASTGKQARPEQGDGFAPERTLKPTAPDLIEEIVMPGSVDDVATPEELERDWLRAARALENEYGFKLVRNRNSPQTGIAATETPNVNVDPLGKQSQSEQDDSFAPERTLKPTVPDLTEEIVMPGSTDDFPTPEELMRDHLRMIRGVKNKLEAKSVKNGSSQQMGIADTEAPNVNVDPLQNE